MTIFFAYFAVLAALLIFSNLAGFSRGYIRGRRDADNWWIGLESKVDQARQQIWREEPWREDRKR